MNAAIAALLNPKIDKDLRLAALSLLQKRMASVDPSTPQRLFLSRPEHQSTIANTLGDDLADLANFDEELERFILAVRPGKVLQRMKFAADNREAPKGDGQIAAIDHASWRVSARLRRHRFRQWHKARRKNLRQRLDYGVIGFASRRNGRTKPNRFSAGVSSGACPGRIDRHRLSLPRPEVPQNVQRRAQHGHCRSASRYAPRPRLRLRAGFASFPSNTLRQPRSSGDRQDGESREALRACGLAIAMLVIRLGQTSASTLGQAIQALSDKLLIAGPWVWTDLELTTAGTPQLRRLFLDPTALAAWMIAASQAAYLPKPSGKIAAGRRTAFYRSLARKSFRALITWMAEHGIRTNVTQLSRLCRCQEQRLRMVTMPLLATYAQGGFASSALEADTWARLIGYRPHRTDVSPPAPSVDSEPVLRGIDPGGKTDFAEQIAEGDLEEAGLIVELRELMSRPRETWRAAFASMVDRLRTEDPDNETARLVVQWLDFLAFGRTNKTKILSDGSIRHYRGLLANRLFELLPKKISDLSSEDLQDAYSEVILSRRSLAQTGHIRAALISFDRCVRAKGLAPLAQVEMPGFSGAAYAISSRIIVESEFAAGLNMIESGVLVCGTPALKLQVTVFWILSFRFGMRRTEILGLQVRDIDGLLLRIRRNEARGLKTINANRLAPLSALAKSERERIIELAEGKADRDYLFFSDAPPSHTDFESHPAIPRINDLLERATGDRRLHPHNLRHSAATLHMLGVLGSDLRLLEHPYREPWMEAAMATAARVDNAISGGLHRKAGRGSAMAMMLGHGSELTSYEHYVHCFDLLLFLTCWSGRYFKAERQAWRYLVPIRREKAQLLAMMGEPNAGKVGSEDIAALIRRIVSSRPSMAIFLERDAIVADTRGLGWVNGPEPIRIEQLSTSSGATTMGHHPDGQSEVDAVNKLLGIFNRARTKDAAKLRSILMLWIEHRRKGDNWASMSPDGVRDWISKVTALMPDVSVQAQHWTKDATGKTQKSPIFDATSTQKALAASDGHFLVRFGEGIYKRDSRRRKTAHTRSRNQRVLTWLVLSLATHLK